MRFNLGAEIDGARLAQPRRCRRSLLARTDAPNSLETRLVAVVGPASATPRSTVARRQSRLRGRISTGQIRASRRTSTMPVIGHRLQRHLVADAVVVRGRLEQPLRGVHWLVFSFVRRRAVRPTDSASTTALHCVLSVARCTASSRVALSETQWSDDVPMQIYGY